MKTKVLVGVYLAILVILAGCATTPVPSVPSGLIYTEATGPVGIAVANYPEYEVVGRVKGKSRATSLIYLVGVGNAGVRKAYERALKESNADALIDVQVDQHVTSILGVFVKVTTIVEGLAVRFKEKDVTKE